MKYRDESMQYYNRLNNHPWLNRLTKKMNTDEKELLLNFLDENLDLEIADFEIKANRLFLDKEKPRRWKEICEALVTINSMRRVDKNDKLQRLRD